MRRAIPRIVLRCRKRAAGAVVDHSGGEPMIRFSIRAALAAGALLATSIVAHAADLPRYKAPVYTAPAGPTWSGFYLGVNGGYGWHDRTASVTPDDPGIATLGPFIGRSPPIDFKTSGLLGGLQLGYNWQFYQNWVAGIETDLDYANVKGNGSVTYLAGGANPFNSAADEKIKWFGTLRARLGYLPMNNLLVYGTGGLAYGKVEQNVSIANPSPLITFVGVNGTCSPASTCYSGSSSRTAIGWTAGLGVEYAFMNNWTLKAEYLYVDLGSKDFTANLANGSGSSSLTANFGQTLLHVARIGVNYRF